MSCFSSDMPDREVNDSKDEIDVLGIIGVLWKRKLLIIGLTLFAVVVSVVFAIVSIRLPPERSPLPNIYKPKAIILVNDSNSAGGLQSALNATGLTGIASLAGVSSSGGYGALAVMLLSSKTILDSVAEEFSMTERYGIKASVRGSTRSAIRAHSTFLFDAETGTLSIEYEDIDPVFATAVVNFFVTMLEKQFATIGGNRNIREKGLLEIKLSEVNAEIFRLESELQDFQRKYGTLSPAVLATEQVTILGEMRAHIIYKEIEIETYSEFSRIDDPFLIRLQAEMKQLQNTIVELENEFYGGVNVDGNKDIPALSIDYARLERDIRVQSRIYEVLSQQYELIKLSVEGEDPIFQVLELADVPDLKSAPSRSILVIMATMATFFASLLLAFAMNAWQNIRNDPERMRKLLGK